MKDNQWSERESVATGAGGTYLRPSFNKVGWGWSKGDGGGGVSGLLSKSLRHVRMTFLKVLCAKNR